MTGVNTDSSQYRCNMSAHRISTDISRDATLAPGTKMESGKGQCTMRAAADTSNQINQQLSINQSINQ